MRKLFYIFVFTSFLFSSNLFAQYWAKGVGGLSIDEGKSIAVDGSGNVYVTGSFQGTVDFDPSSGTQNLTSAGFFDIYFAKYDVSGNYIFAKKLGGTDDEYGNSIAVDASGNVFVTGSFEGTVDFDPGTGTQNLISIGGEDIYFAKYDVNGNYIYAKSFGSSNYDISTSIAVDGSGNVYLTGLISLQSNDVFFAKYDASGNNIWTKYIGKSDFSRNGYSIAVDINGNIYLAGSFVGTADFDPGSGTQNLISVGDNDIYFAKYESSGNYIYAKRLGGALPDYVYSIAIDGNGNVYITGFFQSTADFDPGVATQELVSAGSSDIFFAKYDANGNYVYAKSLGNTNTAYGKSIKVDGSSNVYVTGSYQGTVDFDPGSATQNITTAGTYDIFFAKYDANGNYIFAKVVGGTSIDYGNSIAVDGSGNVYVTGTFEGTADFDPTSGTQNLTSAGYSDIFFAKYSSIGTFQAPPPTITSFTPTSGACGATVTINGTNFNTSTTNNIVWFGKVKASVTNASATQLTVTVPIGASAEPITILNTQTSLQAQSAKPFVVTFSGGAISSASMPTKVDFATGTNPVGIALGDLDGDGKLDMVVANRISNTISVYRNTSTSGTVATNSFLAKVDYTAGTYPYGITLGDIDGDGKLDIAVTNEGSNAISVFRNRSTSGTIDANSFSPKVDFVTGTNPVGIAFGDVTGDGKIEMAVTNEVTSTVSVFRNTSTSGIIDANSFAAKLDFVTGSNPISVAIGDLDGDGKLDMAVTSRSSNIISVFRNRSTSETFDVNSFTTKVDFAAGNTTWGISLGDIDGDGKLDIVVTNDGSNTVSVYRNTSTSGTLDVNSFTTKVDFTTGNNPGGITLGDIDGDGKLDLVVTNDASNTVSVYRNTSSSGTITFASKVDFTTGTNPDGIALGDIDGDGKLDVAAVNFNSNTISVYRNLNPPPTITSFSPTSGGTGTPIKIFGTNFANTDSVKFGGTAAFTFTKQAVNIADEDTITAIVGSGTTGTILVKTTNGVAISSGTFTFIPAPTISSFTPVTASSGATVTITGTNFTNATAVSFGGTNATSFTVVSATSITAEVAGGATGKVSVTTPGGIAYNNLEISSNLIAEISTGWSDAWQTITTSTFTGAMYSVTLKLGNTNATNSYSVKLELHQTDPSPTTAGKTWNSLLETSETVLINSNTQASEVTFKFPGNYILAPSTNYFVVLKSVTAVTGQQSIYFDMNGNSGAAGGNWGKMYYRFNFSPFFTFIPAPTITSFSPTSGAVGATVTIKGTNFTGTTAVKFGAIAATSFTTQASNNSNEDTILAVVASGATGTVSVTTPGGTATSSGTFTFIPAPTITSFTPTSAASGATVTVKGSNFAGATAVSFGGTAATSFTTQAVNSANEDTITAVVASGATGKVSVTTPGGTAYNNLEVSSNLVAPVYTSWDAWQKITTTAVSGAMYSFTLKLVNTNNSNNYNLYLELHQTDPSPSTAGKNWNSLLETSETVTLSKNTQASEVTFKFPGNYILSPSTNYYIVIKEALNNPTKTGGEGIYFNPGGTEGAAAGNWGTMYYRFNYSPFFTFITAPPKPILVNPTANAIIVPVNETLKWRKLETATSYKLQMSLVSDFATFTKDTTTSDTTKYIYGMQNNKKYFWRVRGTNSSGDGPWAVDSFTTIKAKYLVSASSGANGGTIVPSGDTLLTDGLSITYTITANTGYKIDSITIDGTQQWGGGVSQTTTHTFTNVTAPHTIRATFKVTTPNISSFFPTIAKVGETVKIYGSSFTGATSVKFGGAVASSFSVVNDTLINAVVSSGTSGTVSVTTPSGTATAFGFIIPTDPPNYSWTKLDGPTSMGWENNFEFVGNTIYSASIGHLTRSGNFGENWNEFYLNVNDGESSGGLITNGNKIIASNWFNINISDDAGVNWRNVSVSTQNQIRNLTYGASKNIIYANSDDYYFVSTDSGNSWGATKKTFPYGHINAIKSNSRMTMFASDKIYKTTDNGNTFTLTNIDISQIYLNNIFVLNDVFYIVYGSSLYIYSEATNTWQLKNQNFQGSNIAISSDGTKMYSVWLDGLYESINSGVDWTKLVGKAPKVFSGTIKELKYHKSGLYVMSPVGVHKYVQIGQTWDMIDASKGLTFGTHQVLQNNGIDLFASVDYSGLYKSQDVGKTWSINFNANQPQQLIKKGSTLFLLAYKLFKSTDNGGNWTDISANISGSTGYSYSIDTSGNYLYVYNSDSKIYRSSDNGNTFTQFNTTYPISTNIKRVEVVGNNFYLLSYNNPLFVSKDNGSSWQQITNISTNNNITEGWFENGLIVVSIGTDIYFSKDDANSWTKSNIPNQNQTIEFISRTKHLLIASTWNDIYASTDNGMNWYTVAGIKSLRGRASSLTSDDVNVYIGLYNNGIWKRPISELSQGPTQTGVVTQWNFNQGVNYNPAVGTGTITTIGGAGNSIYEDGAFWSGIEAGKSLSVSAFPAQTVNNGQAGVKFAVSTSNYDSIKFHVDWFPTLGSPNKIKFEYSTTMTEQWTEFGSITAQNAQWFFLDYNFPQTVNNNPNFAIRAVAMFDGSGYVGVNASYNQNATWKFDNVTILGRSLNVGPNTQITSFTPSSGNVGTVVNIKGSGFNSVNSVGFLGDMAKEKTYTSTKQIVSVASKSGDLVIIGRSDNNVDLYSINSNSVTTSYPIPTGNITSVVITNDGQNFMVGRDNGNVSFYSTTTGFIADINAGGKVKAMASGGFAGNVYLAVASSNSNELRMYTVNNQQLKSSLAVPMEIKSITMSMDGEMIYVGGETGLIKVYKFQNQQLTFDRDITGHTASVTSLAADWTRQFLISGSASKEIKIWNILSGIETKKITSPSFGEISSVGILFDNAVFYATSDSTIYFFDYPSGNIKGGYGYHSKKITSSASSFDRKYVITGGEDNLLNIIRVGANANYTKVSDTEINATVPANSRTGRILVGFSGGPPAISATDFTVGASLGIANLVHPINHSQDVVMPFIFSWNKIPQAEKYELQVLDTITAVTQQLYAITSDTFFNVLPAYLQQNKKHYWKVRGIKGTDTSAFSEVWDFKTKKLYSGPMLTYLHADTSKKIATRDLKIIYRLEGDTSKRVNFHFYAFNVEGKNWKKLSAFNKALENISPKFVPVNDTIIWSSNIDFPFAEADSVVIGFRASIGADTSEVWNSNLFKLDNLAPRFAGVTNVWSSPEGGALELGWKPAQEKFTPVMYLVYLAKDDSTNLFTTNPNKVIKSDTLTNNYVKIAGLNDFSKYYIGMRSSDAAGNIDTNKIIKQATPGKAAAGKSVIASKIMNRDTVVISYQYSASSIDTVNISIEYSMDRGTNWNIANNISGKTKKLFAADSQGTLTWLTKNDLNGKETDLRLKVKALGLSGISGIEAISDSIIVDLKAPIFSGITTVSSDTNGSALNLRWSSAKDKYGPIKYSVYLLNADSLNLFSQAPFAVVSDTFYKATNLENFSKYYLGVRATDYVQNSDSNKTLKSGIPGKLVSIKSITVAKTLNTDSVQFAYAYSAAFGDTISLSVDYSFNNGATWLSAASLVGKIKNLTYLDSASTLIWLSGKDAVNIESSQMILKVIATGLTGASKPQTSNAFTIDMKAPTFSGIQVAINNSKNIPGSAILSWTPATDLSAPITYRIFQSETSKVYNFGKPVAVSQSDTTLARNLQTATFYYFTIWATDGVGNTDSSKIEKQYLTEFLGDFTFDGFVTPADLAIFVKAWKEKDTKVADIGPFTGTIPKVTPIRDGLINIDDLSAFLLMWNWAFDNGRSGGLTLAGLLKEEQSRKQQYRLNATNEFVIKQGESKAIPFKISGLNSIDAVSLSLQFDATAVRIDSIVPGAMWGDRKNILMLNRTISEKGIVDAAIANFGNYKFDSETEETSILVYVTALTKQRDKIVNGFIEAYDITNNKSLNAKLEFIITDRPKVPVQFELSQNYPNPFNPATTIDFQLPEVGFVQLEIYDQLGRKIATLINSEKTVGYHSIKWNAEVASGVYFYNIKVKNKEGKNWTSIKKMMLLR